MMTEFCFLGNPHVCEKGVQQREQEFSPQMQNYSLNNKSTQRSSIVLRQLEFRSPQDLNDLNVEKL